MDEFRLSSPKAKRAVAEQPAIAFRVPASRKAGSKPNRTRSEQATPDEAKSLLSKAGGAAVRGLHTIGSILSTPSRVLWGTLNGIAGGAGGFGNMNPLDSTGGIELSHVLGNAGVIPKNDPTKWEWGDFGRGLVDIAGDPTTWLTPLGLTKAGMAASKQGALTGSKLSQISRGQRGLVGARIPFASEGLGAVGTGRGVANAVREAGERTGATPVLSAINQSAPAVAARQMFHASALGRSTHATQQSAKEAYRNIDAGLQDVDLRTINAARNMQSRGAIPGAAERHLAEMGSPTAAMRPVVAAKNALHEEAQALGIPTGTLDNTVKQFTKMGPKRAAQTRVLDANGNVVRTIDNTISPTARDVGQVNFLVPNQRTGHFPRFAGEGVEWGSFGGDQSRKAMSSSSSLYQHRNEDLLGNASTDLIESGIRSAAGMQPRLAAAGLTANQQARAIGKLVKKKVRAEDIAAGTNLTKKFADSAGREMDRTRELGQFLQANPQIAETGLFTNHPLADAHRQMSTLVDTTEKARAAIGFMARHGRESHGETLDVLRKNRLNNPPTIRDASGQLGLQENRVAEHVLQSMDPAIRQQVEWSAFREAHRLASHRAPVGASPQEITQLAETLVPDLITQGTLNLQLPAREYQSLTGFLDRQAPRGEGLLSSLNTMWKANMLAHPATQARNAVSGAVTNMLDGSISPWSLKPMKHAVDLLRGQQVAGYGDLPDIQRLMRSQGIDETEALRRLSAVHFPSNHSIAGDLPPGQAGTSLDDMVSNVPGKSSVPLSEMVAAPARTLAGYGENGHVGWNAANPAAIGGAFGHQTTQFSPAMTANMVAGNVEQANRIGGWLGLMRQGYSAEEAARKIGKAQVNYGPREFSETEKRIKNVIPFYAFTSRAGKHVAGELMRDPGGRLGQLVKAQDRSHSTDPSIPDSVLSGTALPLADGEDGTKRFITGLGLQHEPIVHTLGALAGGDLRGAMYDVLGMTNPLVKTPLEHTTGQSFYQRGEPASHLESNIGRTLANVGAMTGLRDAEAGPVSFPGLKAIDTVVGASPLSRYASTARTLTDQRKSIGERLMNTATGVKITDVSPKKQAYEIMKKAENLAKENGAGVRSQVYFSKKELEKLDQTDPQLADRQRELQKLLNSLKAKSATSGRAAARGKRSKSKKIAFARRGKARSGVKRRDQRGRGRTKRTGIRFAKPAQ